MIFYSRSDEIDLHERIAAELPRLEEVQAECLKENPLYPFYHGSSKLYRLQDLTTEIAQALQDLAPEHEINRLFFQLSKTEPAEHSIISMSPIGPPKLGQYSRQSCTHGRCWML